MQNKDMTQISGLRAAKVALEEEIQALKLAQTALKENEKKFRTIVEQAADGILVLQEGERKYYNPAWLEIIGYSSEEYDLIPFLTFVHPDDVERINEAYQQIASGTLIEQVPDFRIFAKSGKVKWISIRSASIEWEGKPAELIFLQDSTRRNQAEQALANSEAHLRRSQEVAHVGSWELDLIRGVLNWSDETYRIFGMPRETPMDYETFLNSVMPEDRNYVNEKWQAALAGAPYDIEHRICAGNVVKWVREKAEIEFDQADRATWGIGVVIDITERKQIEQSLNESELKYRTVVEQATEGIMVVQDYERKYYNSTFREMTGYSEEEYNSIPFMAIVHPDNVGAMEEIYQALISKQEVDVSSEFRIITKSGDTKWLSIHGTYIEWENRPAGMIFAKNITARKQQELEIQSNQRQLQALASQLTLTEERERRRLAVELHDHIGQALALARIQIAEAQNSQLEENRNALLKETSEILKEAIQETRSLVFDLSSPVLNELGLSAAISEWLQKYAGKQAGLKSELVEIGHDIPMSVDFRAILFRSVRELLTNVIRHAQASCVRVTLEQSHNQACITVQDDGIGFQADEISSRLSRSGGFGLFSIQEQMTDLGGTLTIRTTPGEGTKITLCVPHHDL